VTRLPAAAISIEPWDDRDLPLLRRIMGDPEMTKHLGGPETPEKIAGRLTRYIDLNGPEGRMFKIIDTNTGKPAGSVGYWERTWQDEEIYETGWSVLPEFQGRGIATQATEMAIERARMDGKHSSIHALPSVKNAASNAVCKRLGFELLGTHELEYPPGNTMTCNDWSLNLERQRFPRRRASRPRTQRGP
jgi:RimJ/RimL family protein N-acetyltransferase